MVSKVIIIKPKSNVIKDLGDKLSDNFWAYEFICRCGRQSCDAVPISMEVVDRLEKIRAEFAGDLHVSSASRCVIWNRHVGGAPNSYHLKGLAVDLLCDINSRETIIHLGKVYGFGGIGIATNFVHLDLGPERVWHYTI